MPGFSEIVRGIGARFRAVGTIVIGASVVALVFIVRVPGGSGGLDLGEEMRPITERVESEPSAQNLAHSVVAREQVLLQRLGENPADEIARIQLARFYHDSHRPSEAIEHYEAFLAASPESRQVWLDFADCLGEVAEWSRARQAMEMFLDRWPEDPAGMYNLGAILANTGERGEARRWWEHVRDQSADPGLAAKASASLARL